MNNRAGYHELAGEQGVLEVVQLAHSIYTGQIENVESETIVRTHKALLFVRDNWDLRTNSPVYDGIVFALVLKALEEISTVCSIRFGKKYD